jgi:hypothetical protein
VDVSWIDVDAQSPVLAGDADDSESEPHTVFAWQYLCLSRTLR